MLTQATCDAVRPALLAMLGFGDEAAEVPLPTLLSLCQSDLIDWFVAYLEAPYFLQRLEKFASERRTQLHAFNAAVVLDVRGWRPAASWAITIAHEAMAARDVDLGRAFQARLNNMPMVDRNCTLMLMLLVFLPDMLQSPDLPKYRTSLNAVLAEIAPEVELLLART